MVQWSEVAAFSGSMIWLAFVIAGAIYWSKKRNEKKWPRNRQREFNPDERF